MSQNTTTAQEQPGRHLLPRHTFVTHDGQRIKVEASPTFLNVRISVDSGEPIAIPCELVSAVAQALVLASIAARRGSVYVCPQCGPDARGAEAHAEAAHTWPPTLADLPPTALHPA